MQLQLSCKVALISISVASTLLLACGGGSSNPSEGPKAGAGSGVGGGTSVHPASGGSSGSPITTVGPGAAGTATNTSSVYQGGSAGTPSSVGASGNASTEPVTCIVGAIRCNGNVREQSNATCNWIPLPAADQCSGATPACTGAGLCAAYRLVQGTIDTFGAATGATSANYVLTHQTLLEYPTACNQNYCVTGGIQP